MTVFAGYRLTPAQRIEWARGRDAEHTGTVTVRVHSADSALSLPRLQQALDVLAARHESLRLRSVEYPGLREPMQVVDETNLGVQIELAGSELTISASSLIADQASLLILLRELATLYDDGTLAEDQDRTQFIDVSEWQLEEAESRSRVTPVEGASGRRPVTRSGPVPSGAADEWSTLVLEVPGDRRAELLDAVGAGDGDLEPWVLAAWSSALSRYDVSDPDDQSGLELGYYDDGRTVPGTSGVLGRLGAHVGLTLARDLPEEPAQLLATVTQALAGLRQNSLIADPIAEAGSAAAGFAMLRQLDLTEFAGLKAARVEVSMPHPHGALDLVCGAGPDRVTLTLRFQESACAPEVAQRLLESTLAVLVDLPSALAESRPPNLCGPAELALLTGWSGAGAPELPVDEDLREAVSLTDLLDRGIARRDGAERAVVAEDGCATFAELDRTAAALADQLLALGVRPEDPVAVLASRSWLTVAAFVGILRAGGSYLPLDPDQPLLRLRELIQTVGAVCVVGAPGTGERLSELATTAPTITLAPAGPEPRPVVARPRSRADQVAYIIFTSGSTGTPRAVAVEHGSVVALERALRHSVYRNETAPLAVAVNAPFTFDASIKQLIQLASGHTLHLLPEDLRRDAVALLAQLRDSKIDVFDCTPSHLRVLLEARTDQEPLPGRLLIGGEAISPALWDELAGLSGVESVNLYGPTEGTVDSTVQLITRSEAPSVGRPLPGVRTWVLDARRRLVPPGLPGDLFIAGDQVAQGYRNDAQATADRFAAVAIQGREPERMYRSGDRMSYAPDGRLTYLGRLDRQVKINGQRIDTDEVASVLATHPEVDQSVVIAHQDQDTTRLKAFVTLRSGAQKALQIEDFDGLNLHETRYLHDEIVVQRVYLRHGITLPQRPVVFDVGANIGMFSAFIDAERADAVVYAFEPIGPIFEKLSRNTRSTRGEVRRFNYGLSERDEELDFTYYAGYSMMTSAQRYADPLSEVAVIKRYLANDAARGDEGSAELLLNADELLPSRFEITKERCRVRRLGDVIDEQQVERIDLLKIDVQRAELDVLLGMEERHWAVIRQIVMEVHDQPGSASEGRVEVLRQLLQHHGLAVTVEQDELLIGTDRHMLYARRPDESDAPATADPVPLPATGPVQLLAWLAERLPAHLVPADALVLTTFPRTPNGKVDLEALDVSAPAQAGTLSQPQNATERLLLGVWQQVLGRDDVGVEDDFFASGGDSLRGIRMRALAAKQGLSFPLRHVFRYQSIRALVEDGGVRLPDSVPESAVQRPVTPAFSMLSARDRSRLPAGIDDACPMTMLQLGMAYHTVVDDQQMPYHVVTVHQVDGPLDPVRFRNSLADSVTRHDLLRTSFDLGRFDDALQLVWAGVEIPCEVIDLSDLDPERRRSRTLELIAAEQARPFDLAQPPLIRFQLLRNGPDSTTVICAHYHGILDGLSLHLLITGLLRGSDAEAAADSGPAPVVLPYQRFVELERAARTEAAGQSFWAARLDGVQPLRLAPDVVPRIAKVHTQAVPQELIQALTDAVAGTGVPMKSVFLAMHVRALAEEVGQDDVVTGLVVNARPAEEGGDQTLGLFLNTLPVRIDVSTGSLLTLAGRLWEFEQEIVEHRMFPLAAIERSLATGPLFDTFFNYTRFEDTEGGGSLTVRNRPEWSPVSDVAFAVAVDIEIDPHDGVARLTLQYDDRELSRSRVEAWSARCLGLLSRAAREPKAALRPVAALTADPGHRRLWHERVTGLWAEMLGVHPDSRAEFAAAGGDSLLALRFAAKLAERHDVSIRPDELLEASYVEAVVDLVKARAAVR
jgi:amino acid adenylation domain-containing protein/FkbM family methyltransferase